MNRYAVFTATPGKQKALGFPATTPTRAINAVFARDAVPHAIYEADSKDEALACAQEDADTNALLTRYQETPCPAIK